MVCILGWRTLPATSLAEITRRGARQGEKSESLLQAGVGCWPEAHTKASEPEVVTLQFLYTCLYEHASWTPGVLRSTHRDVEPYVPTLSQYRRTWKTDNGISEGSPAPVLLFISHSPTGSPRVHRLEKVSVLCGAMACLLVHMLYC